MIIGIDGNEANVETRVGIGEYAHQLLLHLSEIATQNSDLKVRNYLKEPPRKDMPRQTDTWEYRIVRPKKLWTQIGLPFDLYTHFPKPNVFFTPSHYAPRVSPVPTVISIMDLSYIFFPNLFKGSDLYQLRNWTKYSAKNASRILTISQASKSDIMRIYGIPEAKIVVTYPGIKAPVSVKTTSMDDLKKKYNLKGDFILFVGTLQPRKNIEKLIEAFSLLAPINKDLTLVIVGKQGWLYEDILQAPKKFGISEKVKFVSFVPDDELPSFYKHALCFVLPSLYEGFGLPVVEAMSYGCPVITSNVSSLPEAGGDAALYVDPQSVKDIAEKITMVVEDEKLRKEMIAKGKIQVKKFSWEKTAKETLAVLQEVGNSR